jgi:hypothetical protein
MDGMSSPRADGSGDRNGQLLAQLASDYDFPDFVKQANLQHSLYPERIPPAYYADPLRKQFPCHTAAATWLSALYFEQKRASFTPRDQVQIVRRLDDFARYFQIKHAVDQMRQRAAQLQKRAAEELPDSVYAFVWVSPQTGKKERRLPLRDANEVKLASEWLWQYRQALPFAQRHAVARRIWEAAQRTGASLDKQAEWIEQLCGRGVGDPTQMAQAIRQRALLVRNPPLSRHLVKMAETVEHLPAEAMEPNTLLKLAETLDQIDRSAKLQTGYGDVLQAPEQVVFSVTLTKMADCAELVALTSGNTYRPDDLTKVDTKALRDLFGGEFIQRVSNKLGQLDTDKLAEEVRTLPRPDAEMLEKLLREAGVQPVAQKAASAAPVRFSDEQLAYWAHQYQMHQQKR